MAKIENFGIRKTCVHILTPIITKTLTLGKLPNSGKISFCLKKIT